MPQPPGDSSRNDPNGQMGSLEDEDIPERFSQPMAKTISPTKDLTNFGDEKVPRMVEKYGKSPQIPSTSTRFPASDNIRCLRIGMGRTLQWAPKAGGEIEGSPLCTESISRTYSGDKRSRPDGQQDSSHLCEKTGRDAKLVATH